MSQAILNLGLGALALALIGYGMSSMGPTHLDYQIAKACYSFAALLIIFLVGVWLISNKWTMGIRVVIALVLYGAIGAGWATLIGIAQNREENQRKNEAKKAYTGKLQPEKKVIFSGKDNIYPELEIGDSGTVFSYAGPPDTPFIKIAEDDNIKIEIEGGEIKLSTKIRDKNGQIIAELINNEWKVVPPPNSWDRNYSPNALEVRDPHGDVILQVRLVENRVQFQAKLYDSTGRGVGFVKSPDPERKGCIIELTGPAHPNLDLKIIPIFKYPSELHLGEFVDSK